MDSPPISPTLRSLENKKKEIEIKNFKTSLEILTYTHKSYKKSLRRQKESSDYLKNILNIKSDYDNRIRELKEKQIEDRLKQTDSTTRTELSKEIKKIKQKINELEEEEEKHNHNLDNLESKLQKTLKSISSITYDLYKQIKRDNTLIQEIRPEEYATLLSRELEGTANSKLLEQLRSKRHKPIRPDYINISPLHFPEDKSQPSDKQPLYTVNEGTESTIQLHSILPKGISSWTEFVEKEIYDEISTGTKFNTSHSHYNPAFTEAPKSADPQLLGNPETNETYHHVNDTSKHYAYFKSIDNPSPNPILSNYDSNPKIDNMYFPITGYHSEDSLFYGEESYHPYNYTSSNYFTPFEQIHTQTHEVTSAYQKNIQNSLNHLVSPLDTEPQNLIRAVNTIVKRKQSFISIPEYQHFAKTKAKSTEILTYLGEVSCKTAAKKLFRSHIDFTTSDVQIPITSQDRNKNEIIELSEAWIKCNKQKMGLSAKYKNLHEKFNTNKLNDREFMRCMAYINQKYETFPDALFLYWNRYDGLPNKEEKNH